MEDRSRTGVLLLQLGTPDSPSVSDVRRFLREFLSDPRVLDIPRPVRWLLLNLVILPFRPRRSAHAYRQIWLAEGSPLTIHTEALASGLREELGDRYEVAVGMRYRLPTIESAVDRLAARCDQIVVIPLFPQYASASTGSAVQHALEIIASRVDVPALAVVPPFFDDSGFVDAVAAVAEPLLDDFQPDHVLFSYHGLPEKQIRASDPSGSWCLADADCCARVTGVNAFCYRAQCFATSRAVAKRLGLGPDRFDTSFQSRLAGQKWIEPYTDHIVARFRESGVSRLAVLTPSFTADCLETLEEIGIRLRKQWSDLGGEDLLLVPCVNAHPTWIGAVAQMVQAAEQPTATGS